MRLLQRMRRQRLLAWLLAAVFLLLLIGLLSPHQLPITGYKLALVSLAAVMGYHLDRALFPYASPGSYLIDNWKQVRDHPQTTTKPQPEYPLVAGYELVFAAVLLRRAVVVAAVILGVTLGL